MKMHIERIHTNQAPFSDDNDGQSLTVMTETDTGSWTLQH